MLPLFNRISSTGISMFTSAVNAQYELFYKAGIRKPKPCCSSSIYYCNFAKIEKRVVVWLRLSQDWIWSVGKSHIFLSNITQLRRHYEVVQVRAEERAVGVAICPARPAYQCACIGWRGITALIESTSNLELLRWDLLTLRRWGTGIVLKAIQEKD